MEQRTVAALCAGSFSVDIWHSDRHRSDRHNRSAIRQQQSPCGNNANRLATVCNAARTDGQRRVHCDVLSVGFVMVRNEHGALPLVDHETRPRGQLRRGNAVARQAACRNGVSDDRLFPVYPLGPCSSDPQPVFVA